MSSTLPPVMLSVLWPLEMAGGGCVCVCLLIMTFLEVCVCVCWEGRGVKTTPRASLMSGAEEGHISSVNHVGANWRQKKSHKRFHIDAQALECERLDVFVQVLTWVRKFAQCHCEITLSLKAILTLKLLCFCSLQSHKWMTTGYPKQVLL